MDKSLRNRLGDVFYRYASLPEAMEVAGNGRISFVHPRRWNDKYEHFIQESAFGKDGPFSGIKIFAKCFSDASSSEALWRLFSTGGPVIRYGFRLRDLVRSLNSVRDKNVGKIYVALVRYQTPTQIKRKISSTLSRGIKPVSKQAAKFLFHKRDAFHYEKELRVVVTTSATDKAQRDIISLNEFSNLNITRILIDPYVEKWQAQCYSELFSTHLKFSGLVEQSRFDDDVAQ